MSRPEDIEILPPDPAWQPPHAAPPVVYEAMPPPSGVVSDVYEAKPTRPPRASAADGDARVIGRLLRSGGRIAVVLLTLAVLVWALEPFGPGSLQRAVQWLRSEPQWGRGLVVLAVAAGVPFFVPVGPLAVVPGYLWGSVEGVLWTVLGAVLGGLVNFHLSRRLLGPHVLAWLRGNQLMYALYSTIDRRGARVLLGLRLSPLMPFGLLSYLGGLTSVPASLFAVLMAIGGVPWTAVYAMAGAMLGASQQAVHLDAVSADPLASSLRWLGLAMTVVLAVWLGRVARRDLLAMRQGQAAAHHQTSPGSRDTP